MNPINIFYGAGFVVFCVSVFGLLLHAPFTLYLRYNRRDNCQQDSAEEQSGSELFHLIQLPVFNENPALVSALLHSAAALDYPQDRFCVQLLDDSDIQEISSELQKSVKQIKREQPDLYIHYLHRQNRSDFKAGNLNFGLEQLHRMVDSSVLEDTNSVVISIFDADFEIPSDYLKVISGHFGVEKTGIVQSNTCFRNSKKNFLTKAQTVFQNNLQYNEFAARSRNHHLSTFRGSAGSIRFSVIEECGFWKGDTQIEDVDLSFLAQSLGWEVVYDNQLVCSSLLPESYNEYKLQQRSWVKGLMEVMRKRIGGILRSEKLTNIQKLGGLDFFFVLSLQTFYMTAGHLSFIPAYNFYSLFGSSTSFNIFLALLLILLILTHIPLFAHDSTTCEVITTRQESKTPIWFGLFAFLFMVAMFCTFTVGLIEGIFGRKVYRDRTGKGGPDGDGLGKSHLPHSSIRTLTGINCFEIAMAGYSLYFIGWALAHHQYFVCCVYGVFTLVYPLNAIFSFRALRELKR